MGAPGLPALLDDLRDLARDVADLDAPHDRASRIIAEAVRSRAPRRTGYLANSVTPHGPTVDVLADYAPFVAARHPFLSDGYAAAAPAAVEVYADHVEASASAAIRPRY